MAIPFENLMPQEVVTWQAGETKVIEGDSITYDPALRLTDPKLGTQKTVPGLVMHVYRENGNSVSKYWRIIQTRLIATIRPFIENGSILQRPVKVYRPGAGVKFDMEVVLLPVNYQYDANDLKSGPYVQAPRATQS